MGASAVADGLTAYAWRRSADEDWIELAGEILVEGFGETGEDVRLPPGFVESWTDERRAACGVIAVTEAERPLGVTVLGSSLGAGATPVRHWLTADLDPGEVTALRAAAVAAVKVEARSRIEARYPIWQQINMLRNGENMDWIDAVRDASELIESAIPDDAAGLASFDVAAHPAWPA